MNCPMHCLIFRSRGRSYRELPLRLFEFGSVYRYEMSGVVHGLTRVRGMTQDDAHIYCTEDQMQDELKSLLQFVLDLLKDYGLDDFYLELSTRDPEKSIGSDEEWERATDALEQAAAASGLDLVLDPGGAAFYAPKISVQARDAIGRTWQMSTIQVDLMLPERFGLEFTAPDGTRQRPVMIHRALFGSVERFVGVLTEHYAGAFPPWLSPVQVVGIPVAGGVQRLPRRGGREAAGRRRPGRGGHLRRPDAEEDPQRDQQAKVPFMLIAGGQDAEAGAVSFRYRDGRQDNGVPVDEAVAEDHRRHPRPRPGLGPAPDMVEVEDPGERPGVPDAFQRLWTPHRMVYIGGREQAGDARRPRTARSVPHRPGRRPGRADRAPRRARLRGLEPLPVLARPPAGLPVPARGRPDRR